MLGSRRVRARACVPLFTNTNALILIFVRNYGIVVARVYCKAHSSIVCDVEKIVCAVRNTFLCIVDNVIMIIILGW